MAASKRRAPSGANKKTPRPREESPKARAARAVQILDVLAGVFPDADCELDYETPFQLLVATILSAQCTDRRVNEVTPALFARFPDAAALAGAGTPELEALIRPTGFFRAKARSLLGCSKALVERHGGVVPRTMAEMVELPGAGRKTSSVVLGHAFGLAEGIAVDTHVRRVANRLGIVEAESPAEIEAQLMALLPRDRWIRTTDLLIFHGRRTCAALRPQCGTCPVFALCRWEHREAYASGNPPRTSKKRNA